MTVEGLLILLFVGALAGWLAGLIVKGRGLGLVGNIVIGILGALISSWLLPRVGIVIGGGLIGSVIHAMIGAIILLVVVMAIRRA
ncbi:MAG TPA: GlsB/YeaQ/YmgE family stress response membrane protein [Dokdonella sp.]|uniref:GlsB/YeaQ/YmgE family stress response membrane protein n=1 Tax=Dokdonella sp. TaxID=2291710 RepID=UPI002D80C934|nr:GlsB/YeaQ/YmgE family stress response membrane protein [Dokdonella sp.]HET9034528.1 GlsB/YeaQ/YmgE family stress response membrane protein [Dokdonella sp.]